MKGDLVIQPPAKHTHSLPSPDGFRLGSVTTCGSCGRWMTVANPECWGSSWYPVRWYHFQARRLIRDGAGR